MPLALARVYLSCGSNSLPVSQLSRQALYSRLVREDLGRRRQPLRRRTFAVRIDLSRDLDRDIGRDGIASAVQLGAQRNRHQETKLNAGSGGKQAGETLACFTLSKHSHGVGIVTCTCVKLVATESMTYAIT